jgi:hypothetical protein
MHLQPDTSLFEGVRLGVNWVRWPFLGHFGTWLHVITLIFSVVPSP